MVFSERSHYKNPYPDIAYTIASIGLYDYTFWLMGALLISNYPSVRRYVLAVEILLLRANSLTCLPYFSATSKTNVVNKYQRNTIDKTN